jgi:hypothetical protein
MNVGAGGGDLVGSLVGDKVSGQGNPRAVPVACDISSGRAVEPHGNHTQSIKV